MKIYVYGGTESTVPEVCYNSRDLWLDFIATFEVIIFKQKLCHFQWVFRKNGFLISFIQSFP